MIFHRLCHGQKTKFQLVPPDKAVLIFRLHGPTVHVGIYAEEPFMFEDDRGMQEPFIIRTAKGNLYGICFVFNGNHVRLKLPVPFKFYIRAETGPLLIMANVI